MQANELRIGNIVEWNRKPFKVCSISMDIVENELWSKPLQEIHPIPLTEEILTEWCRLDKDPYRQGYTTEVFSMFELSYTELVSYINSECFQEDCYYKLTVNCNEYETGCKIKYLHQLQNLYFALSGEELQIKLP